MSFFCKICSIVALSVLCFSCQNADAYGSGGEKLIVPDSLEKPLHLSYAWLAKTDYKSSDALVNQIPVPKGYRRVQAPKGSFAEWLRYLPLNSRSSKVMLYDGSEKSYQKGAERIINIEIGNSDLQQCADAVMRLKAEFHYSRGEYNKIHFNFTSGHKVSFDDWRKGKKPTIKGNNVSFSAIGSQTDNTYSNFKKYLRMVFSYAGTASLEKELATAEIREIKAGDVFIKGGFPGHAVLVMDVAENIENGSKIFLLSQSYMPAQSIHLLKNFDHNARLSPWYPQDFGETLHTPEWEFKSSCLKKWK
jgi:hypothetical protein